MASKLNGQQLVEARDALRTLMEDSMQLRCGVVVKLSDPLYNSAVRRVEELLQAAPPETPNQRLADAVEGPAIDEALLDAVMQAEHEAVFLAPLGPISADQRALYHKAARAAVLVVMERVKWAVREMLSRTTLDQGWTEKRVADVLEKVLKGKMPPTPRGKLQDLLKVHGYLYSDKVLDEILAIKLEK